MVWSGKNNLGAFARTGKAVLVILNDLLGG